MYKRQIGETLRKHAAKLLFASPGIRNPELFLRLFEKNTDGAIAIEERTVAQHRFFIDLIEQKQFYFSALDDSLKQLEQQPIFGDAADFISHRSKNYKAIVYLNGPSKAVEFARRLADRQQLIWDDDTESLVSFIQDYVHSKYYLAETLRHGVAFHHGRMPQKVRERVEEAFADPESPVKFIVCTSTLLEGVNLPAKNIFIISDRQGGRKFTKSGFENLAGRAGRLTYDFSGNIICIREKKTEWKASTRELIRPSAPQKVESFIVDPPRNRTKEYKNIERIFRGEDLPSDNSASAREASERYASILTIQQLEGQQSRLKSHFVEKIEGGRSLVNNASKAINVPTPILSRSPQIKPEYQEAIWTSRNDVLLQSILAGENLSLIHISEPTRRS